jgi:hypothetical protein
MYPRADTFEFKVEEKEDLPPSGIVVPVEDGQGKYTYPDKTEYVGEFKV